jgi:AcrR family transcriptional regulator
MGRPAILSRERITAAGKQIVEREGPQALTLKRLGGELGVDASALYRHFRNKDELVSAIGDELLSGYVADPGDDVAWREGVTDICVQLRAASITQPVVVDIVRFGPPRQANELKLTEVLLRLLRRGGLDAQAAGDAYHALISLTLGSAAIDAQLDRLPRAERQKLYRGWRRQYATLPSEQYPTTVALAEQLWRGTAEDRFRGALEILLDGLQAGISQRR